MAWSIFKQEMQGKMQAADWGDISEFADFFTKKYDECMKRGTDAVTNNTVIKGNTEIMRSLIIGALQVGNAAKTEAFYGQSIALLGKGVIAYWSGAEMGKIPPTIPAPGTIINLSVVSNTCTNPGVWPETPISVLPSTSTNPYLDSFILMATIHLQSISGICNTISQYPPIATPGPAILTWTGYTLEPYSPQTGAVAVAALEETENIYDKLDWSQVPLEKDDPDVQAIINPQKYIEEEIENNPGIDPIALQQVDEEKAEILTQALVNQGLYDEDGELQRSPDVEYDDDNKKELTPEEAQKDAEEKVENGEEVDSGYKNLDELLRAAGRWARRLGKNPLVKYENLKIGYKKGIHGNCGAGTKSIVCALIGSDSGNAIGGSAHDFSFKAGKNSSFPSRFYNSKRKVDNSYLKNSGKWQTGDIIACGYTERPHGHIQIWTGWAWVSDFTQRQIQFSHVDTDTFALWRLNSNGLSALSKTKKERAA